MRLLSRLCVITSLACMLSHGVAGQTIVMPDSGVIFTVAGKPWPEGLGSQRAVIEVTRPSTALRFSVPWRRHDPHPQDHRLLLVHASTGDTVRNIMRLDVNNEECTFIAGPCAHPGTYYLYYLAYEVRPGRSGYGRKYEPVEPPAGQVWLTAESIADPSRRSSFVRATTRAIEARTSFDSFFPMEVIPTRKEKEAFFRIFNGECLVFPEGRENPIRMRDELPFHWLRRELKPYVEGHAGRNEYFTFQLGVYAAAKDLHHTRVIFDDLLDKSGSRIPGSRLTCFNTNGIDATGRPFTKDLHIGKGTVQPLWIGVDIPADVRPGSYAGSIEIRSEGVKEEVLLVRLIVRDTLFADRGDDEPWRHSCLRWLNSRPGIDSNAVAPYPPVTTDGAGNPWRGMVYGMSVRYPWVTDDVRCDPRAIWNIWEAFGIGESTMKGYWDGTSPVTTERADILATTFQRPGTALIAIASWAHDTVETHLRIDWKALGLDPATAVLRAPAVEHLQPARIFKPGEPIPIDPGRGWMLIAEPARR